MFSALLAISTLNVEDEQISSLIAVEPDTFRRLLSAHVSVHDLECSVKEQVEKGRFAGALTPNDCHCAIVRASLDHLTFL